MMNINDKFKRITLQYAQTPHDGAVVKIHVNDFWFIYKDNWILTNKQGGPMCNSDRRILEMFSLSNQEYIEIRKLDTVYIPWDTTEYIDNY